MSDLLTRIEERLEALGLSPRAASLKAGLSPDAIRNIQRGKSSRPRGEALAALARALECDVRYLLGETDAVGEAAPGGQLILPVRYTVAAGAWREVDDTAQTHRAQSPAQVIPGYERWPQWLEEVEGDSINRLIPDGALVHVVDAQAMSYEPRHDDLVVVLRTRSGGHLQERTLKQVELKPHGILLWPRSYNDRWSKPLDLSEGVEDDEEVTVQIVGKVLRAYIGFGGT